jgi:hypothetical protein
VSGGQEYLNRPRVVGLFHQAPKHVAGCRRNYGDRHVVLSGAHFPRAPRKRASIPARLADLPFAVLILITEGVRFFARLTLAPASLHMCAAH